VDHACNTRYPPQATRLLHPSGTIEVRGELPESSGLNGSCILLSLEQYLIVAARGDINFIALLSLPLALDREVQSQIELCLHLLRAGGLKGGQEKGRHG